jgi:hypothetical protein
MYQIMDDNTLVHIEGNNEIIKFPEAKKLATIMGGRLTFFDNKYDECYLLPLILEWFKKWAIPWPAILKRFHLKRGDFSSEKIYRSTFALGKSSLQLLRKLGLYTTY